jgi:hypothetical protein
MHDSTFHGLHEWTKYMFEKLGWMAKAQKQGNKLKIDAYLDSIHRLHENLEHKLNKTKDADRKDDLHVLLEHTSCLDKCAIKLLSSTTSNAEPEKEYKCVSGDAHDATNCGIGQWVKHKYEKLGWMCLAKEHGHKLKISAYIDGLERLKASIELKIKNVQEADRKADLEIHLEDICILQAAAHKLLSQESHHHMHHETRTSRQSSKRTKTTRN